MYICISYVHLAIVHLSIFIHHINVKKNRALPFDLYVCLHTTVLYTYIYYVTFNQVVKEKETDKGKKK